MIGEATVDCYNEAEQRTGIYTMLEENLALPFATTMLGMEITVDRIELTASNEVVAVCRRQGQRQRVPLLDLPLPTPRPAGADWIDAYRRWARQALRSSPPGCRRCTETGTGCEERRD